MRVALITTPLLFAGGVSAAASAVEVSREAVIDAAPGGLAGHGGVLQHLGVAPRPSPAARS
jgi:hypothetical protein